MASRLANQLPGVIELNEIDALEQIAATAGSAVRTDILATVTHRGRSFPIRSLIFERDPDPTQPVLALFGGVHGLERIGSEVVLAYLRTFCEYAAWDRSTME